MIRIGIAGIEGRMGREILGAAHADTEIHVAGGLVRAARAHGDTRSHGQGFPVFTDIADLLPMIDVLIDFTTPDSTMSFAHACADNRTPIVCGTTGLSSAQLEALRELGLQTPVFYSRNMSIGINALLAALPGLVRALDGYDIAIVEAHHRHKADAPSGTALALAEAIAGALDRPLERHATYGRHGVAPRQTGEIGIHAVRAGGNAGEHTVLVADEGEEIQIVHRAYSRRTFAAGALRAARFLATQAPGFYAMPNLLPVLR